MGVQETRLNRETNVLERQQGESIAESVRAQCGGGGKITQVADFTPFEFEERESRSKSERMTTAPRGLS